MRLALQIAEATSHAVQHGGTRMAKPYLFFGGMTWPNPEHAGDLEWKMRYALEHVTRGEQLTAASILAAYRELVAMPQKKRNQRISQIIKAVQEQCSSTRTTTDK